MIFIVFVAYGLLLLLGLAWVLRLRDSVEALTRRLQQVEGSLIRRDDERGAAAKSDRLEDSISTVASDSHHEHPKPAPRELATEPSTGSVNPLPVFQSVSLNSTTGVTPPPLPRTWPESLPPVPVSKDPAIAKDVASAKELDLEQFLGGRLLSWVGGLVLFLAVAFFVKLSFERGWIPPALRAAGGALLGGGLIAGGAFFRRKESITTSQTLCATGILTLYGVTFACHGLYHFPMFTAGSTFVFMALITAGAFALALWMEAQVVAVLGMVGGFLTPVLLSSGENNPGGLFTYVALLDAGLLAVVWRRRWDYLAPLAALGTVLMQAGWYFSQFTPPQFGILQGILIAFALGFGAVFAAASRRGWVSLPLGFASSAMAVISLAYCFILGASAEVSGNTAGIFLIATVADLLLLMMVVLELEWRRLETVACGLMYLLVGEWMLVRLNEELMGWGLGLTAGFAAMHTLFPLWLRNRHPEQRAGLVSQVFPAMMLLLMFVPLIQELRVPWGFWPVVALVDLLAVVAVFMTGSILALGLVLLLTLGVAGVWLNIGVGSAGELAESLCVVGGYAVFFFLIGCWLSRNLRWVSESDRLADELRYFPGMAAVLPFALLNMVVVRLAPANPTPIFGIVLLLLGMTWGWSWWKRDGGLALVAVVCAFFTQFLWYQRAYSEDEATTAVVWFLGFLVLSLGLPMLRPLRFEGTRLIWVASAVAGPLQFLLVYSLVKRTWPNEFMGLVPALFALPYGLALCQLWRSLPVNSAFRLHHLSWFGGVSLGFVTLIFPIQFERQILTVAWALEGMALVWLFRRLPHPGLRLVGVVLLVLAFARLAVNPAVLSYPRSGRMILNWYLYSYGMVTAALYIAGRWLAPPRHHVLGRNVQSLMYCLGTILLFVLVNLEIADAFASGPVLRWEFSGSLARDLSYTVAWAVFAFGLLALGLRRGLRAVRYAGLALMGITLAKLLLHDTARLEQLYRIAAFTAVAVLSMVASFLYQRFQHSGATTSGSKKTPG